MDTMTFRAVVRGNDKAGKRVRRVRNVEAPSFEMAWVSFEAIYAGMAAGLTDVYPSILPPSGLRVDGTASVGFGLSM